jgi:hypothetical protein
MPLRSASGRVGSGCAGKGAVGGAARPAAGVLWASAMQRERGAHRSRRRKSCWEWHDQRQRAGGVRGCLRCIRVGFRFRGFGETLGFRAFGFRVSFRASERCAREQRRADELFASEADGHGLPRQDLPAESRSVSPGWGYPAAPGYPRVPLIALFVPYTHVPAKPGSTRRSADLIGPIDSCRFAALCRAQPSRGSPLPYPCARVPSGG